MNDEPCPLCELDAHDDELDDLEKLVEEPRARRELSWLRAARKGDLAAKEELERLDPAIPDRLESLARAMWELAGRPDTDDPDVRRDLYEEMYDTCLCHHVARRWPSTAGS